MIVGKQVLCFLRFFPFAKLRIHGLWRRLRFARSFKKALRVLERRVKINRRHCADQHQYAKDTYSDHPAFFLLFLSAFFSVLPGAAIALVFLGFFPPFYGYVRCLLLRLRQFCLLRTLLYAVFRRATIYRLLRFLYFLFRRVFLRIRRRAVFLR